MDDLTAPMLSLLNVRYALAPPRSTAPPGWHPLGTFPGFELLENAAVLPRAFIPAVVHEAASADVAGAMTRCRDFGHEAWVESDGLVATHANGGGDIAIRRRGSKLRLGITMKAPGWVVVSEPAWRGWRVLDGDQPLAVHFADGAFLGFHLAAGAHDVKIFYRPQAFVIGATVTGGTLLLLLGWGIVRRFTRQSEG